MKSQLTKRTLSAVMATIIAVGLGLYGTAASSTAKANGAPAVVAVGTTKKKVSTTKKKTTTKKAAATTKKATATTKKKVTTTTKKTTAKAKTGIAKSTCNKAENSRPPNRSDSAANQRPKGILKSSTSKKERAARAIVLGRRSEIRVITGLL